MYKYINMNIIIICVLYNLPIIIYPLLFTHYY